jgi:hypothetical protein
MKTINEKLLNGETLNGLPKPQMTIRIPFEKIVQFIKTIKNGKNPFNKKLISG